MNSQHGPDRASQPTIGSFNKPTNCRSATHLSKGSDHAHAPVPQFEQRLPVLGGCGGADTDRALVPKIEPSLVLGVMYLFL
jgi:hypothetical protein